MTGRERVLAVLNGTKPDITPVDIGAIESSGVSAAAYGSLKASLGISGGNTRVSDPIACVVRVEKAFREKLKLDAAGLFIEPRKWRPSTLPDGSDGLVPEKWVCKDDEGAEVFRHAVAELECRRDRGKCAFRYVGQPLAECTSVAEVAKKLQAIAFFDWPYHADEIAAEFGARARSKRQETSAALVLNVRTRVAGGAWVLRGEERILADVESAPAVADAILERLANATVARLTDVLPDVAVHADAVCISEGPCPGLTLEAYRSRIRPHHERILSYIRSTTAKPIVAVVRGLSIEVIRDMLELGIDAVAPMLSPGTPTVTELREGCGPDVPLWGAGIDPKALLARKPKDVRKTVKKALEAIGGNCIFAFGNLVLPETSGDNVRAALEAARKFRP